MVHVSETCEPTAPHLLTHVHTTPATVHEAQCTDAHPAGPRRQGRALRRSTSSMRPISARSCSSPAVTNRASPCGAPRAQARAGRPRSKGRIPSSSLRWIGTSSRCAAPKATCRPRGGSTAVGQGSRPIIVAFDKQDVRGVSRTGRAVPVPSTRADGCGCRPRTSTRRWQAAQTWSASEEGQQRYQRRAGVEGTLSQGVRAFGLRRTRYWGVAKTHLQHVAIAAAINIDRIVAWLDERPRAMTRISRFAALAPANAYNPGEAAA